MSKARAVRGRAHQFTMDFYGARLVADTPIGGTAHDVSCVGSSGDPWAKATLWLKATRVESVRVDGVHSMCFTAAVSGRADVSGGDDVFQRVMEVVCTIPWSTLLNHQPQAVAVTAKVLAPADDSTSDIGVSS